MCERKQQQTITSQKFSVTAFYIKIAVLQKSISKKAFLNDQKKKKKIEN